MELTDDVIGVCHRAARRAWAPARGRTAVLDFDDLLQQALLTAWQAEEEPLGYLYRRLRCRLIDYLRVANPINDAIHVGSLDEPGYVPVAVPEPGYDDVEAGATAHRLLADDLGDPRGRAVVWLRAHGTTLAAIGDHLGITESRACRIEQRWLSRARERYESDVPVAA